MATAEKIIQLIRERHTRYQQEAHAAFSSGAEHAGYAALILANDYARLLLQIGADAIVQESVRSDSSRPG